MFRPLELFIGLRYTRAKRRNQFISFISTVSIVCIAISVTALITVMSVMNGFDSELRSRILGAVAHVTVSGIDETVRDWERAVQVASATPHVKGAAPYVEIQAFLQARRSSGAIIRGVVPSMEPKVSDLDQHMVEGKMTDLTDHGWNIILGRELALELGVTTGDKVTVVVPQFTATPMGAVPKLRNFTVSGIFELGMQEYDSNLALISMPDAERLNGQEGPTGIRLKLDDMREAGPVAQELVNHLGQSYRVQTWMDTHANFFHAIDMEKTVMFVILSLIILVAVINLISMLMMLVTDKQADIAILRTLGSTPRSIMAMFMVQGLLVGVVGIGAGVALGSLLSYNLPAIVKFIEHVSGHTFLAPDVYYISEVPSQLLWSDVGWVVLVTFGFSLLATLYPAWRASRRCSPPRRSVMNNPNDIVLRATGVAKVYEEGDLRTGVLSNVNFELRRAQTMSIVGASGSGKSTLLHIIGGLDTLSAGKVEVNGRVLSELSDAERGRERNRSLGFIYQFHHLLPEFTALENVCMPLLIRGVAIAQAQKEATALLERVGLGARLRHRPAEMSGGERQRCAVARALVTRPACVLGDEPTGNLDEANAAAVYDLMVELNREIGTSFVLVTHDPRLAKRMDRTLELHNGELHER